MPASATIFEYDWNLSIATASKAIASFQSFVQTNIPAQLGVEINLGRGSTSGTVSFSLTGGWYGAQSALNAVLAPLLAQLPKNPSVNLRPGTYMNSVAYLGGGSLSTTKADMTDTFYAKSMMTPASSPLSSAAINAFISYLANQGFTSNLVRP